MAYGDGDVGVRFMGGEALFFDVVVCRNVLLRRRCLEQKKGRKEGSTSGLTM